MKQDKYFAATVLRLNNRVADEWLEGH